LESGPALPKAAPGKFDIFQFSGLMTVDAPGLDKHALLALGEYLESRDDVEYCVLESLEPPSPPQGGSATPDYSRRQGYLGPNPGVDCRYAWSQGIRGQGIQISDIEYDWNLNHEDLRTQNIVFGMPKRPSQHSNHGTAVMGVIMAAHNGFGMDGCAPQATGRVYPETHGRAAASSLYGSLYPSVQNLLLAARAAGLGATLTTLPVWSVLRVRRILGLPWRVQPVCAVPLGWPRGRYGPTTRRPVGEVVHLERYGNRPDTGAER
jgi:nitroreductase